MKSRTEIDEFIERATTAGASEQALVEILRARGWPEKKVYNALATHYERLTGMEIPQRGNSETAAKDAFFHLLIFSTLATWTIALGTLAFTLTDTWLADTLFGTRTSGYDMYSAAASIAAVLVAFPIYLLVSKIVLREEINHPEKLLSPVRRWLTYMALVVAACVFIGDLVAALTYFLRGEITSRFLVKAAVVLVISGGVFFYYFGGLRRSEAEPEERSNRDTWMAVISSLIVIVLVTLGFSYVGSPGTQRTLRADRKRTEDLYQIASAINVGWHGNSQLPQHLQDLQGGVASDPVTGVQYEYRVIQGSEYELCANFAMSSDRNETAQRTWSHPAGRHCFSLDAAKLPDNPAIYFPD